MQKLIKPFLIITVCYGLFMAIIGSYTLRNTRDINELKLRELRKQEIDLKAEFLQKRILENEVKDEYIELRNENITPEVKPEVKPEPNKLNSVIREVTAYNAGDINQCWGDPCESANGENICLALELGYKRCAANFVPFGTILHIEHYGDCMVTDRMNSRYTNRVDIAMKLSEYERAKKFGLQKLLVTIKE